MHRKPRFKVVKGMDLLKNLDVDGLVILKNFGGKMWTRFIRQVQGFRLTQHSGNPEPDLVHATGCKQPTLDSYGSRDQTMGSCEQGNERSSYVRSGK
jgi:hypothetical protein